MPFWKRNIACLFVELPLIAFAFGLPVTSAAIQGRQDQTIQAVIQIFPRFQTCLYFASREQGRGEVA